MTARQRRGIVRRHQAAADAVGDQLGDAGDRGRHHRQPHRHRLGQHVGDDVALAGALEDDAGEHEQIGAGVDLRQPACGSGPVNSTRSPMPSSAASCSRLLALRPLADQTTQRTGAVERGGGAQQNVVPLVRLEAAAGDEASARRCRGRTRQRPEALQTRRRGSSPPRARAGVVPPSAREELGVDLRAGDGELGLAHLHAEQARHQIDVVGVGA